MRQVKSVFYFILLCCISSVLSAQKTVGSSESDSLQRPRIALVLSGGGAKGFAHVGVLKVIDSLQIPVDYVVGTSMGSIIGGLYASGYSATEIENLIRRQDWEYILTDRISRKFIPLSVRDEYDRYTLSFPIRSRKGRRLPRGLVHGQNIMNLFCRLVYHYDGGDNIEDIPVKFACVATDLVTGKAVVIDSGFIAKAMRASMSIPYVFTPVDTEDMLLVDGGMCNNFPANVARDMGADIIIGVDVQSGMKSKQELRSGNDMIDQAMYILGKEAYAKSLIEVDIYIKPDIKEYRITDFNSADSLIVRGERAALNAVRELTALQVHGKSGRENRESLKNARVYVAGVKFTGLKRMPSDRLKWRITFKYPGYVEMDEIWKTVNKMYGTLAFETVYYRLDGERGDTLNFICSEKMSNTFNVGLRFDTWENAALLLNTTFRSSDVARNGSIVSLNLKLSEYPRFLGSYTLDNGARPGLKLETGFNSFRFYNSKYGRRISDTKAFYANFTPSVIATFWDSYSIGAGVDFRYYKCRITDRVLVRRSREEGFLINYFAYILLDTREKANYARTGIKLYARFQKITDNGLSYKKDYSLYRGYLEIAKPLPLGKLTFIPQAYVAGFFGEKPDAPVISRIFIGGPILVNGISNHIPFIGMRPFDDTGNGAIVFRADFQYEMWKRNYLIFRINALKTDGFATLRGYDVGMGLTYAYESVIGPIEGTVSWSRVNNQIGGFINIGYCF